MKRTCSKILHSKFYILHFRRRRAGFTLEKAKLFQGFTLIELLVVISIIGLLFTIGIAAYQEFNRGQIVVQAAQELKESLRLAQSKALAGEKPAGCTGGLLGWRISAPNNSNSYQLQAVCSGATVSTKIITLPGDLEKKSGPTTILFKVLTPGVEGAGTITIKGFGNLKQAKVTITASGEIKMEE